MKRILQNDFDLQRHERWPFKFYFGSSDLALYTPQVHERRQDVRQNSREE